MDQNIQKELLLGTNSTSKDLNEFKSQLLNYFENSLTNQQDNQSTSINMISKIEKLLQSIVESHFKLINNTILSTQSVCPNDDYTILYSSNRLDSNEEVLRKRIDELEFKLRKKKLKIKSLKDSLKEQSIRKFCEFENKITNLIERHQEQEKELSLIKEEFIEKNKTDFEKGVSVSKNVQNYKLDDSQNETNKNLKDLFDVDIARDISLEENEKLKGEQALSKIMMEYLQGFNEKSFDDIYKIMNKNHDIQQQTQNIMGRTRSGSQSPKIIGIPMIDIKSKEFQISAATVDTERAEHNKDELSWINDELKRSNDEFLLFQDQLTKMAHEKLNLINENKLKDDYIKTILNKVHILNQKFIEIKQQLTMFENQESTTYRSVSNSDLSVVRYDQRIKELEEENNRLRETVETLKKNQKISSTNTNTQKLTKNVNDKLGSTNTAPRDQYVTLSNLDTQDDNSIAVNLTKTFNHINIHDSKKSKKFQDSERVTSPRGTKIFAAELLDSYDTIHKGHRKLRESHTTEKESPKSRLNSTQTKEHHNNLLKKYKTCNKIIDRIIDFISDYATGAYETIKLIAFDKKHIATKSIKEIIMGIQNFSIMYKKKHKDHIKNKDCLNIEDLYDNLQETIIKLLDYHDELKNLKENYYKKE